MLKMEKLNNLLQEQIDKNKAALQEEKSLNIKLQAEINVLYMQQNKRQANNNNNGNNEQLNKEINKLKNQLEKTNVSYKSEIEKLELRCQSFETDLEISQQETRRLVQEVEEYKKLGSSFRKVVDELTKKKDQEILTLKEKIEALNEENNTLQEENEHFQNSKDQFEQYVNYIRSMDYEKRIQRLETSLNQAEVDKRKLHEQLISGRSEGSSTSPLKNSSLKVC